MSEQDPPQLNGDPSTAFPEPPWHLFGTAVVSAWLVPADVLTGHLPPALETAGLAGRAMVGTAFATYGDGGTLAYNELVTAIRVRGQSPFTVTISHIWVDSEASAIGARTLWSIPKQMAEFDVEVNGHVRARALSEGRPIAGIDFNGRLPFPGRWSRRLTIAQRSDGRLVTSTAQLDTRLSAGTARWTFPGDGPLAFLRGRRPLFSLRLDGLELRIGL